MKNGIFFKIIVKSLEGCKQCIIFASLKIEEKARNNF